MRADTRRDLREFKATQARRLNAPESDRLAEILWALAEAQTDPQKHTRLGLMAGTVDGWANRGYNVSGPEILEVLSAVAEAFGVKP